MSCMVGLELRSLARRTLTERNQITKCKPKPTCSIHRKEANSCRLNLELKFNEAHQSITAADRRAMSRIKSWLAIKA